MAESLDFSPTYDYAFASDDSVSVATGNSVEYNPYPNYQADVINSASNNSDLGDNSAAGINTLSGGANDADVINDARDNSDLKDNSGSGIEQLKDLFKGANRDAAQTGRSVDQILKEYGLSDKVVSSLIQVGGGMLAGASSAKMAEKNRNETWARDDAVVAKERARREANYKAGKVNKLNYKPTGLLEAMKK